VGNVAPSTAEYEMGQKRKNKPAKPKHISLSLSPFKMSLKLFANSILGSVKWTGPLLPAQQKVATTAAAAFHTSLMHQQASAATSDEIKTVGTWSPNSVRTGVIAKKKGMTSTWSAEGVRIPVTVLQVRTNQKRKA
jgi:hypothetical protein